jgi:hypothetical protein
MPTTDLKLLENFAYRASAPLERMVGLKAISKVFYDVTNTREDVIKKYNIEFNDEKISINLETTEIWIPNTLKELIRKQNTREESNGSYPLSIRVLGGDYINAIINIIENLSNIKEQREKAKVYRNELSHKWSKQELYDHHLIENKFFLIEFLYFFCGKELEEIISDKDLVQKTIEFYKPVDYRYKSIL